MKCHFANSDEPLKEGLDIAAECFKQVTRARFVAFLDSSHGLISEDELRNSIGLCRVCRKVILSKRFVYVICNGQEVMDVSGDTSSTPVSALST